jgi:hypothetical protein
MNNVMNNTDAPIEDLSTYLDRQSSTKTEAVLRYVDLPIIKLFVQFVTPLSNPGSEKPEEKDVMIEVHPKGEHDEVMFNTGYEADIIDELTVVRDRVNMSAREDRLDKNTTRHDDDEDENNEEILSSQSRTAMESVKGIGHGKPGMETVMVDISKVVMSNTEYEADIIDAAQHGVRGRHHRRCYAQHGIRGRHHRCCYAQHGVRGWHQHEREAQDEGREGRHL